MQTVCDADAGPDYRTMFPEIVGLAEYFDEASRKRRRLIRLVDVGLHDRKFVTSKAHHNVSRADIVFDSFGNGAKECIANRMSKSIIHILEAIEVQTKYSHRFAAPAPIWLLVHVFVEYHTVRQTRKRVMTRHVREPLFSPMTVRYVFMG